MSRSGKLESRIGEMIEKHSINELMKKYCRGMDRADQKLLESVFHPDAMVITGTVDGPQSVFCREIVKYLTSNSDGCYHSVNDGWIEIDGSRACGEFYVLATMTTGNALTMGGGRYADEFEVHEGRWKIRNHTFISDWLTHFPDSGSLSRKDLPSSLPIGMFGAKDYIYDFWLKNQQ